MPARRIAFVSHSAWLGGAERCLLDLVASIAGPRDVHVVLPHDGALRPRLEAAGAQTHLARARWWARDPCTSPRPLDVRGAARTARVLARLRPDVVVSWTLVHPPGAFAAAVLRIPHVWWLHEFGGRDHGFEFLLGQRGTLRAVGRLSRAVVVSSAAVREEVGRRIPARKLRLVPYAVDVPAVAGVEPGRPGRPARLAILGRVRPSKGQQDAVRALAALRTRGVAAALDVVGDGELGLLRALAAELGVDDAVRVHGPRDDALAILDGADVALMCSRDEAFGRVTVEAMKRGKPVVGAASGGTAELIEDGVTGLRYAAGDHEGLAAAVAALLADDRRRARIAEAGRRFATAAFTAEGSARAFLEVVDA